MIKLIILLGLAWIGYMLFSKLSQRKQAIRNTTTQNKSSGQAMVACEKCGVHVPKNEAVVHNKKNFCSKEHITSDDNNI